jgi:hypothetical protein
MRLHFISRLALLLAAGFLVVASQVWTGDTLQWLFVAGGAVMIVLAVADAIAQNAAQRAIDALLVVLGAWTVVQAFIFDGNDLKWWSFASACALAGLAALGLIVHEMSTERVVHELSVTAGHADHDVSPMPSQRAGVGH